jgi:hypothetical protein
MTGAKSIFSELDTSIRGTVHFGDSSQVEIEGSGMIIFTCRNGEHRMLTGVYYIPRLTASIITLGQLDEADCKIDIERGVLRIFEPGRKLLARVKRSPTRLYLLDLNIGHPICLAARSEEAAWRWHGRFSHLSFKLLRQLAHHDMVRGLPPLEQVDQISDACLVGKQRRTSFPDQARRRARNAIELVHGDICGPIAPTMSSGNVYFLLLVDDMSRYMWLMLLPCKDHAPAAIRNFQVAVEVETGRKLKALRTDRGGSSLPLSSGGTARRQESSGNSPPHIHLSIMVWWSDATRAWLPWCIACSRQRLFPGTSGVRQSIRLSMS